MIHIITGMIFVIIVIVTIYLLGLIPNIWSNELIHPLSLTDVFDRGFRNIIILFIVFLVILLFYTIGSAIYEFKNIFI